jgi:hypothetical protein
MENWKNTNADCKEQFYAIKEIKENTNDIVYVYEKDSKIKVLNHKNAIKHHNTFINNGWFHKSTLNSVCWIEKKLNKKS